MIDHNKSGLQELLAGKIILRVETTEQILFKKDKLGSHYDDGGDTYSVEKYIANIISIYFTDGTKVSMHIRRARGLVHNGSGGVNIYEDAHLPFIFVS
jgi:hypothetical protein